MSFFTEFFYKTSVLQLKSLLATWLFWHCIDQGLESGLLEVDAAEQFTVKLVKEVLCAGSVVCFDKADQLPQSTARGVEDS
jgi:hypothetical protein